MATRRLYGAAAVLVAAAVVGAVFVDGDSPAQVGRAGRVPPLPPAEAERPARPKAADLEPVFLRPEVDEPVYAALKRKIDVSLADVPLEDVAKQLSREVGVEIVLDREGLAEAGIAADTRVTLSLRQVSLKAALRIMLRRIDLTYVVHDGQLLVTDASKAGSMLEVALYPVADLVNRRNALGELVSDYDTLMEMIECHCAPSSWDGAGGLGRFKEFDRILAISQAPEVHEWIADFLRTLRLARDRQNAGDFAPLNADVDENTARVYKALDETIDLEFANAALAGIGVAIGKKAGINVLIDERALFDEGIDAEELQISGTAKGVPLRTALRNLLRDADLAVIVQDEVLLITTADCAGVRLATVIYPCRGFRAYMSEAEYEFAIEQFLEVIPATVASTTWDAVGGAGSIHAYVQDEIVVVSQTREVHREIAALLDKVLELQRRQHEAAGAQRDALETRVYDVRLAAVAESRPRGSGDGDRQIARQKRRQGSRRGGARSGRAAKLERTRRLSPPAERPDRGAASSVGAGAGAAVDGGAGVAGIVNAES